jgi:hypothetical protein
MNKTELLDRARELGVEGVDEDTKNEDIEAAIKAKEEGNDTPAAGDTDFPAPEDLEHSEGGATTKDATDAGVPMLPGDPSEPVGPEDALGEGDKRGDYSDRQDGAEHYETVANPNAGNPVYAYVDKNGARVDEGTEGATRVQVDVEPAFVPVRQNDRVNQIGDVPGEKGGVTTA